MSWWWGSAGNKVCQDDDYLKEKSEAWRGCWIIMLMFSLFQQTRGTTAEIGFSTISQQQLQQHRTQHFEMHKSNMYCCYWGRVVKPNSNMLLIWYLILFQMTVTYVQHIPNSGCWGFYRVLAKWRGSLYKVGKDSFTKTYLLWKGIWRSLVCYCLLYAGISVFYRQYILYELKLVYIGLQR